MRGRAVPRACGDEIVGPLGDQLKIRISAPPEGGKANQAIIRLLVRTLGIPRERITLASGETARGKIIEIRGLSESDAISARLAD